MRSRDDAPGGGDVERLNEAQGADAPRPCVGTGEPSGPGRKPYWLKKPMPKVAAITQMEGLLRQGHLHTVCESALCPNLAECFASGTATFMILGDVCTRGCRFCGVTTGIPSAPDTDEPGEVARAAAQLGLRHVVITSVTRDDLPDGGAAHFAATISAVRSRVPGATVEVLVPDFGGVIESLDVVLGEAPEVFNHNVETVPRLYTVVRPQAVFLRSVDVLRRAAERGSSLVKTGWMVGLGETPAEVERLLDEVAAAGVKLVTIGQYLRPSSNHLPVTEYVAPEVFEAYRVYGESLGLQVQAGPFVRSSFHAGDDFARATARGETENECS